MHPNTLKRHKRTKKFLKRLVEKKYGMLLFKQSGKSPQYYAIKSNPKTFIIGHRQFIDLKKTTIKIVPKKIYFDTIKQLTKMCKGITVKISGDI